MAYWMSIEVIDGEFSASTWQEANADALTEAALSHGAVDWSWHRHTWGVVFEVAFEDEAAWDRYRESDAVNWALERVPDPVSGIIISRGRGGSAGTRDPRKPRPLIGSGAASLPVPFEVLTDDEVIRLFGEPDRRLLTVGA